MEDIRDLLDFAGDHISAARDKYQDHVAADLQHYKTEYADNCLQSLLRARWRIEQAIREVEKEF